MLNLVLRRFHLRAIDTVVYLLEATEFSCQRPRLVVRGRETEQTTSVLSHASGAAFVADPSRGVRLRSGSSVSRLTQPPRQLQPSAPQKPRIERDSERDFSRELARDHELCATCRNV